MLSYHWLEVANQQTQAEFYGVYHHKSLTQNLLDYTLEILLGLIAVEF